MDGFRFLYWDDYEAPKGDSGRKSDGSTNSPKDDAEGSRVGKDAL